MHILFICTGNTCRSPMAEGFFRDLVERSNRKDITVSSAGTFAGDGESPSINSITAMKDIGIDISHYESSLLTLEMINEADLIIAMTISHKHAVGQLSAAAVKKCTVLGEYNNSGEDVSDPFGGSQGVYGYCLTTMKPSLENLFKNLAASNEV